ncbi:hypothetical protein N9954_01585 [Maribacter sp.]|nr:hypothetical protein [Maribacter sp.]
MQKSLFTLAFGIMFLFGHAQEQFVLSFDHFQIVEDQQTLHESHLRFPSKARIITIAGLNDLQGIGNYLEAFGTKLLIDDMQTTSHGVRTLIFRREDGRKFYEHFSTLSAKLTPLAHHEKVEALEP